MDKISAYTGTADVNDEFTEGDPAQAIQATEVDEGWLNGVQRELLEVMTQMGLTPSSADDTLVWQAVQAIYGKTFSGDPNSNVAANVVRERCWDTSTSPPTLYIATAADGTTGGTTWTRFTDILRAASTTLRGVVELATNTETQAGTDTQRAVTPAGLASALGVTGAMIPLSRSVASDDASIVFNTMDSTYDLYILRIEKLVPATDGVELWIRTIPSGGGSTGDSGANDYEWVHAEHAVDEAAEGVINSTGDTRIEYTDGAIGNASGEMLHATILVPLPGNSIPHQIEAYGTYIDVDNNGREFRAMGFRKESASIIGVEILMSSGNISSGVFNLYGVKTP